MAAADTEQERDEADAPDEHEHHDDGFARRAQIIRDTGRQAACAEGAGHFEYDVDQVEATVLDYGDRHDAGEYQHDGERNDGKCPVQVLPYNFSVEDVDPVAPAAECDEEQYDERECRRTDAAAR